MPNFIYKAKNLQGELLEGAYEAANADTLKYMLSEKGYFLVHSFEKSSSSSVKGLLFGKVKIKDISIMCRQFAVILNSGITLVEAVSILKDQTDKQKLREVLSSVHEEIQKGKMMSDSFAAFPGIFPEFMTSMLRIGEASGSLDLIMNRLAEYYEKENKIHRKIRTALAYPMIIGILTVGIVILLLVVVLPTFSGMLNSFGGKMPGITLALMGLSKFMAKYFLVVLLAGILIVSGISYYLKTVKGRYNFDKLKLNIPVVSKSVVKIITSRFARSMGILLKSGIPIVDAIHILSNLVGNKVVEEKFKDFSDEVKEGKGISGPIKKMNFFPPILINMIAVGESTGELDDMLSRTAGFFDEEVEEAVEKLVALIEPIMIVVMAAIVGSIVLSIILPIISIMSSVN